jgi:hypothetical protein
LNDESKNYSILKKNFSNHLNQSIGDSIDEHGYGIFIRLKLRTINGRASIETSLDKKSKFTFRFPNYRGRTKRNNGKKNKFSNY